MRSSAPTVTAGVVSTRPFSLTRPSAISRSASRREQRPARAITLAMRSPLLRPGRRLSFLRRAATHAGLLSKRPEAKRDERDASRASWSARWRKREAAGARGEIPVGAVLVRDGEVIAAAGNRTRELADVTAHAEVLAIRAAAASSARERLTDCDLYVTLEPCTLCAAAISFARIRRLYYGAADPKGGGGRARRPLL